MNGVAEVWFANSASEHKYKRILQLHSELVRTTILKDFVDYYGISKYDLFMFHCHLLSNITQGSEMSPTAVGVQQDPKDIR